MLNVLTMNESRNDRLKKARVAAGYTSASKAARAFGWAESTYLGHEGGTRGLKYDIAEKYARAFKVSLDWLMTGSGPMKPYANSPVPAYSLGEKGGNSYRPHETQVISIPLYNVSVSGGHGVNHHHVKPEVLEYWPMPRELIRHYTGAPAEKLAFIRVVGESMIPDYQPGQIVLVDLSQTRGSQGHPYVVAEDDLLVIKKLDIVSGEPPKIKLISTNPAFPPFEKHLGDVVIIGRVIGKWSWS